MELVPTMVLLVMMLLLMSDGLGGGALLGAGLGLGLDTNWGLLLLLPPGGRVLTSWW